MKKISLFILLVSCCLLGNAQTWQSQTSNVSDNLNAVFFSDANTGYAVGDNGTILKTTNGGSTWTKETSGTTQSLKAVHGFGATVMAAGSGGTVLIKTGGTWQKSTGVGSNFDIYDILLKSNSEAYCVGACGTLLKSSNNGGNWLAINTGILTSLYRIRSNTNTTFISTSSEKKLQGSTANGLSSSALPSFDNYYALAQSGNTIYIGGNTDNVLVSTNNGTNWTTKKISSSFTRGLAALSNQTTVYACGENGIYKSLNSGSNWTTELSSTGWNDIFIFNDNKAWAVGNAGKISAITLCSLTKPILNNDKTQYCENESVVLTLNNANQYTQGSFTFEVTGKTASVPSAQSSFTVNNITTSNNKAAVTVSANGCTEKVEINLTIHPKPTFSALIDATIACNKDYTLGSNITTNNNHNYQWTATNGGNINGAANILNAKATSAGQYTLLVTDKNTTCAKSDTVLLKTPPTISANAGNDDNIACNKDYTLAATQSSNPNYAYQWTASNGGSIKSGANTLNAIINKAGTYTLLVTDKTYNCTATDIVVINPTTLPNVTAGNNYTMQCPTETYTLAQGIQSVNTYNYLWGTNDGNLVTGSNTLNATVNKAGTYTLTVTDVASSCTSVAKVVISKFQDIIVDAGKEQNICTYQTKLNAQLPSGNTGKWTVVSGSATINDTESPNTSIFGLKSGTTELKWTLSKANCPNYAAATVKIISEQDRVVTVPDLSYVAEGQLSDTINLITNDNFNGVKNWNIEIVKPPFTGSLIALNKGIYQYDFDSSNIGNAYFDYKICSELCKDSCSTAKASIIIKRKINTDSGNQAPAIVTPNGDGMNDNFVVDEIDKYPENQLYIYNRWGAIVWQGVLEPKGWAGVNQSGGKLENGTYYYIIHLKVAEGKTIFGDILLIGE